MEFELESLGEMKFDDFKQFVFTRLDHGWLSYVDELKEAVNTANDYSSIIKIFE